MTISHRFIETNGIRMHLAEAGSGPTVLLCHGFPECWYSWRHQLEALAAAGYRAVAPDMRGYGQTDKPDAIDQYTLLHLTGDMVGLLDAIGTDQAVVVGHDWGAPVAWRCALFRPDRFRAVVGLSVPFQLRGPNRPSTVMPRTENQRFYQLYFQTPGVAEAELEKDVHNAIKTTLFALSGDAPVEDPASLTMLPGDGGWLDGKPTTRSLPTWLTDSDIEFYVEEFKRTGFAGGLNWYRNIDRNWELLAPWSGAKVQVPAVYVVGDRDGVYRSPSWSHLVPSLKQFVPLLRETIVLKGCGHWTQQERAKDVSNALLEFLKKL